MLESLLHFVGASQALTKSSYIKTTLQPHQEEVRQRAQSGNLLIAHGMGSGKTLSSIAAADAVGGPSVDVFTPAPLTENYKKEILKHRTGGSPVNVRSVSRASLRDTQIEPGSTMVVDEAHLARNPSALRSKYLKAQAARAGRVLLLTGTPTYNKPSNLAPLINMVAQKKVLPEDPREFQKQFISEKKVDPGFIGKMLGVKPGITRSLKNRNKLLKALRGRVHVFEQTEGMPERIEKDVDVKMSPAQQDVYRYVEKKLPLYSRLKIRWNLPLNKTESKNLNAFSAGLRQASNTPGPYIKDMSHLQAAIASPKMTQAMDSIKEKMKIDPDFRGFVYSNYKDAGTLPMAALLRKEKIPYAIYHGGLNTVEKKNIVDRYNNGEIKVLLGTSAATEGLDLKGTKLIQVLEPHFNESKTEQAIARGIRFGSHAHLPEDARKVLVERYYSKPTQGFFTKLISGKDIGIDRYLRNRALDKKKLSDQIKGVMLEAQQPKKGLFS